MDKVEALFRRYRRDAVLLYRPYPPHQGAPANSKYGGLPNLPAAIGWPRTSSGTPLHFLAQVDCSEIPFPSPLPERGMLFFFGRDDEEQVWNFRPPASDDCRVIHALDAFAATPERSAPDDLGPIGGYYPGPAWRDYLAEGARGPNLHVEWPIRPLRFDSWPDPGGLPENREHPESGWRAFVAGLRRPPAGGIESLVEAYEERLGDRRIEAFEQATGRSLDREARDDGAGLRALGGAIFYDGDEGDSGDWPGHWIYVHYAARALLHRPAGFTGMQSPTAEEAAAAAEGWLERSSAAPLDSVVPDAARAEFRSWIATFRHPEEPSRLGSAACRLVVKASEAAVRAWAGSPQRAALIPDSVYEALAGKFGGLSAWGLQFSQMLGHAPSAQDPLDAGDPTVCLASFTSDAGMGWMFGDMGEASFWIAPGDLARRDFAKVWATVEGH